jgi:hypothetical protein
MREGEAQEHGIQILFSSFEIEMNFEGVILLA